VPGPGNQHKSNSPQVSTFKCNSLNSWIAHPHFRNFSDWLHIVPPTWHTLHPQHDTRCTPNENVGVQSENPKKKIRKSLDFRPDFPFLGPIVPLNLRDNPGTQKKGRGYKGMWYSYNHPHFHSEVKSWKSVWIYESIKFDSYKYWQENFTLHHKFIGHILSHTYI